MVDQGGLTQKFETIRSELADIQQTQKGRDIWHKQRHSVAPPTATKKMMIETQPELETTSSRKSNVFDIPAARLISTAADGKRNIKALLAKTIDPMSTSIKPAEF